MSLKLICPKCEATTELRGAIDAWYLTWCHDCERLWRIDFRQLLELDEPAERVLPAPSRLPLAQ